MVKNGQNGQKWSKSPKMVKIAKNGPKWSKMVPNGSKWSQMVKNGKQMVKETWSKWSEMVKNGKKKMGGLTLSGLDVPA